MAGSRAISSHWAHSPASSSNPPNPRRKRDFAEVETIPATSSHDPQTTGLTAQERCRKLRRTEPSSSTGPRALPTQPHEELLQELGGRYEIATTSIISSSKIAKKVTAVLSHLGHVDLFNPDSRPGVMMLHARASDASKMVTVMELAKRRMGEAGVAWYQYNRVYEISDSLSRSTAGCSASQSEKADGAYSQTVIKETILDGGLDNVEAQDEESEDRYEEGDAEEVITSLESVARDKPSTESKSTYMSMFLSRVRIPELQSKSYMTLQTNEGELRNRRKA